MSSDRPTSRPKPLDVVSIPPPTAELRARRDARFRSGDEKANRYTLPASLESTSPVGYRTRVSMTREEAAQALQLLSMERPSGFARPSTVTERELFEESSLGVLSARQSTNFRGHRQITFGTAPSVRLVPLLRRLKGLEAPALNDAAHTHVVLARPYRTPFTAVLTLVGHPPVVSPFTWANKLFQKKLFFKDDIPTIGYLPHLHIGVLADAMERAAVIASGGRRRAQVFTAPFCGKSREENAEVLRELEDLCGLTLSERMQGWRIALVGQVGDAREDERLDLDPVMLRKLGANLLAFRSERILPGSNAEPSAPLQYQRFQEMSVPEELTIQAGRAAYNAFAHWTGVDREKAKELFLLDRVDSLTPEGKVRLDEIKTGLNRVTDRVKARLPMWADIPTGRAFSKGVERGRKAFGLAGQSIYFGGLSKKEIAAEELDWDQAVRAFGAAVARSSLYVELMGVVDLPADCDMLAGVCIMAGPVNQNDIGKHHFGDADLLSQRYGDRDPTSLLVWTLKAKTVTDPIGNEEQLLNARRQGALVDLRMGPHEAVTVVREHRAEPMRKRNGLRNSERAFSDADNFARDPSGRGIPGNAGTPWPMSWQQEVLWGSLNERTSILSDKDTRNAA